MEAWNLKLQYNTYTVIEAYFLNCRCNLNCFVSSVIRSTNVSGVQTSVQDGFPWKLLSVVRWDSSHRLHLTFYHKKINHHDLKALWAFRKSHVEGLRIVLTVFIKDFYKAQYFTTRGRILDLPYSRSYSKISKEIGLEVFKSWCNWWKR